MRSETQGAMPSDMPSEEEKRHYLERAAEWIQWLGLVLATVGVTSSIFSLVTFESATLESAVEPPRSSARLEQTMATRPNLDSLLNEVRQARRDFQLLRSKMNSTTGDTLYLGRATLSEGLDQRLSTIEEQQAQINEAITTAPAEALKIPSLRRDISELSDSFSAAENRTRASINNLYTVVSWSIGGVIIALVSILGSTIFLIVSRTKT